MYSETTPIHRLFEQKAKLLCNRIAVIDATCSFTFGQLNTRANQLASFLRARGIGRGSKVVVYASRSANTVLAFLAVMKSGAAYVPVEAPLARGWLKHQMKGVQAPAVLTERQLADELLDCGSLVVAVDEEQAPYSSYPEDDLSEEVLPDDPVYLMYTSGSTGQPKGAIITHAGLSNYAQAVSERFGFSREPLHFVLASSFSTDLGNTCVMPALVTGGTLHVLSPNVARDPVRFARAMEAIDVLKITPTHLNALMSGPDPAAVLPRKVLVFGGEVLSFELVERLAAYKPSCRVANHYGPTETTIGATCTWADSVDYWRTFSGSIPIGTPLSGVKLRLLRDSAEVAPGEPGELYIGGIGVARGYLSQPELTARQFVASPLPQDHGEVFYKTGDLCRQLPDGNVEFLGRADRQVKIRGFRVEPGEIEAILRGHPAVHSAAVKAVGEQGSKRLVAYLVPRSDVDQDELRRFINHRAPAFMVPSEFLVMKEFPLSASGKVDYNSLPQLEETWQETDGHVDLTPEQTLIRESWQRCLRKSRTGLQENFLSLGGDSITAIQISSQLRGHGVDLSPQQIFDHPTILEQARVCRSVVKAATPHDAAADGAFLLSPIQEWFFAQNFPDSHYWNQGILVEVETGVAVHALRAALQEVAGRHDALRLGFSQEHGCWKQFVLAALPDVPLRHESLSGHSPADQQRRVAQVARQIQDDIRLATPPLFRAVLFDRGPEEHAWLMLIAHHLVIDAVSWRVILADLQYACGQARPVAAAALRPEATSFQQWMQFLLPLCQDPGSLRAEMAQWISTSEGAEVELPVDRPHGDNSEAAATTLWCAFSREDTEQLLALLPSGCSVYEMLLTALARTLCPWAGHHSGVLIDVESHGRENFGTRMELADAVGWFTSLFPLKIDCIPGETFDQDMHRISERVRSIPHKGLGYGLLRYCSEAGDRLAMSSLRQPRFCFNYLGRFHDVSQTGFRWKPVPCAFPCRSGRTPIGYDFKLNGRIINDRLYLDWVYSRERYCPETMLELATELVTQLGVLLTERLGISEGEWPATPDLFRVEQQSTSGLPMTFAGERRGALLATGGGHPSGTEVLLTGATGYLGIYLLREILASTNARVHCVVRGRNHEEAMQRLVSEYKWYFPDRSSNLASSRVRVLAGDVGLSQMGLHGNDYRELLERVTDVFHSAADVRLIAETQSLVRANVLGTRHMLEFATTGTRKRLHHISTLSVVGSPPPHWKGRFSEHDLDIGQTFSNPYERSKFEAEMLLRDARREGTDIRVYRFGNLVGNSRDGRFQRNIERSRIYLNLKAWIETGLAPYNPEARISFSYVDYVARSILALAFAPSTPLHSFHVENRHTLNQYDLVRILHAFGYPIALLERHEYAQRLASLASREGYVFGLNTIWGHRSDEGDRAAVCSCTETEKYLSALDIVFPRPTADWFRKMIRHCIDVGFLNPPPFWDQIVSTPEILSDGITRFGKMAPSDSADLPARAFAVEN
jgi:amino acid adenylation domain-containing protein/thioester reductase-like protein/non-ribosomal peptide synthase protein (TIGR01720 family)